MSDQPLKDTKNPNEGIPPPKDLPEFFKQERIAPVVPPLPPQLHPMPQPKIVVAPPTPCPLTSPTDASSSLYFVMPEPPAAQAPATVSATDISPKTTNASSKKGNHQPKAVSDNMSDAEHQLDKLDEAEEESGVLGWLQKRVNNSTFLSKVADKAKTGMDSVLTTLDPGMKDFMKRDGSLDIVVASDNARVITAIADGFRKVFTTLSHHGMSTPGAAHLQPQIIGHSTALKYMNERITLLRSAGLATAKSAVIVFQPFLHEIEGEWYESAVIGAQKHTVIVHVFTQPVQVDSTIVTALKNKTPENFAPNAFAVTVGSVYAETYGTDADDWQIARYSMSSSEFYRLAATMLANSFKEKFTFVKKCDFS